MCYQSTFHAHDNFLVKVKGGLHFMAGVCDTAAHPCSMHPFSQSGVRYLCGTLMNLCQEQSFSKGSRG